MVRHDAAQDTTFLYDGKGGREGMCEKVCAVGMEGRYVVGMEGRNVCAGRMEGRYVVYV
jgi:hypothetical protein